MLRVMIGDIHYRAMFFKRHYEKDGKDCIDTRCEIYVKHSGGNERLKEAQIYVLLLDICHTPGPYVKVPQWTSVAFQHPKDSYDKIKGKKIALARSLAKVETFRKTERALFWAAFRRQFHIKGR